MPAQRIALLYNTDYDHELTGPGIDVGAVELSCRAIAGGLRDAGRTVDITGLHGTEVFDVLSRVRAGNYDLVFNLCESMGGDPRNEPTFAGLLDLFSVPYTGADLVALASCLHKRRTKEILVGRGVSTPPYRFFATAADLDDATLDALDYPWFLKLAHEDASVGITEANRVVSPAALRARAKDMIEEFGQAVLAERYIDGREINVGFVGNGASARMLPLHEIDFAAMPADRPRIVSYAAKWEEDHVDYVGTKPVPLRAATPEFVAQVEQVARAAWVALGLRDYGRIDLRVDGAGKPWVIDVNPNCDISPDAGMARAAGVAGIAYPQLVALIADTAYGRYAK
jgi:D-alanine-D-alanine ligase